MDSMIILDNKIEAVKKHCEKRIAEYEDRLKNLENEVEGLTTLVDRLNELLAM